MSGSLFDIVGPKMVGPSSSHTAGAVRLGRLAVAIAGCEFEQVEMILYNSFAQTYQGHGTDLGLLAGLMDLDVGDEQIRDAKALAQTQGLQYRFTIDEQFNTLPPNTVRFRFSCSGQTLTTIEVLGHSIGGGRVAILAINGYDIILHGDLPTALLVYKDQPGMIWQTTKCIAEAKINIASLQCFRKQRHVEAMMAITLDSPLTPGIKENMNQILDVNWVRYLPAIMD